MAKYQILRMRKDETRWSFMAHGAAYEHSEAKLVEASLKRKDEKVKLIRV
jgi:hypothetical protein